MRSSALNFLLGASLTNVPRLFVDWIRIHFIHVSGTGIAKFSGERMQRSNRFVPAHPRSSQIARSLRTRRRTSRLKPAASREERGEIRFIATKQSTLRGLLRAAFSRAFQKPKKIVSHCERASLQNLRMNDDVHPAGNSSVQPRDFSQAAPIRLRTTAPPRAFLMLKPKRLCADCSP